MTLATSSSTGTLIGVALGGGITAVTAAMTAFIASKTEGRRLKTQAIEAAAAREHDWSRIRDARNFEARRDLYVEVALWVISEAERVRDLLKVLRGTAVGPHSAPPPGVAFDDLMARLRIFGGATVLLAFEGAALALLRAMPLTDFPESAELEVAVNDYIRAGQVLTAAMSDELLGSNDSGR